MKLLFIDASRGLAGDMLSAALAGLFDDPAAALSLLEAAGLPELRYELFPGERCGVRGNRLRVICRGETEGESAPDPKRRDLADIRALVARSALTEAQKAGVLSVYDLIAEAEGEVHGVKPELVHFHELGALDALADISAACVLIGALKPDRIVVSPVRTGFGSVRCAHGSMPVPAPATARLLKGVPCFAGETEGELCTPTGAALVRAFADEFSSMPPMTVRQIGVGLGSKDFGVLSCVRAFFGDAEESVTELCCNVDDMSPEAVGFAVGELLRAGALDAWSEPICMKKSRPGLLLSCLCGTERRDEFVRLIFRHTTTLGVRETLCRRYILRRREELVETPCGPVRVKVSEGHGVERRKAEFEDLARIARERDLSLGEAGELLT